MVKHKMLGFMCYISLQFYVLSASLATCRIRWEANGFGKFCILPWYKEPLRKLLRTTWTWKPNTVRISWTWKIQTSLTLPTKLLSAFKKCFQDFDSFHAPQFQTHVTCPPGEATAQVQRPASHQTCSQEIIPEKSWSKEPSKIDIDRMIGISVYHDVIRREPFTWQCRLPWPQELLG